MLVQVSAKSREDPRLQVVPGGMDGPSGRILTVEPVQYDAYLKEWLLYYTVYVEPGPCPCCGQPRGAGSLHGVEQDG